MNPAAGLRLFSLASQPLLMRAAAGSALGRRIKVSPTVDFSALEGKEQQASASTWC